MGNCTANTTPGSGWEFCPSTTAAEIFIALFAITTIYHIYQGIVTRKWYTVVVIIGALWETFAYIGRVLSIHDPASSGLYSIWFILILVAPLWINGFVYMILGRMVWNFLPSRAIFGIKASRMGLYFVSLDILAFLVQMMGAVRAVSDTTSPQAVKDALNIYLVGCGIQQLFILIFLVLAIKFYLLLRSQPLTPAPALRMLYTMFAVILLITIRVIFRLIEYSNGFESKISTTEWMMYVFDSVPMMVALVLLNVTHPGVVMPGKENDIPGRKERKAMAAGGGGKRPGGEGWQGQGGSTDGLVGDGDRVGMQPLGERVSERGFV